MPPPYLVLLAGYRSTADPSPIKGISPSDCTIHDACGEGDAVRIAGTLNPDLIVLCDLLPERDGLELVKRLRKNPDTEDIPIILVIPDGGDGEHVIRGLDAGADDCLARTANHREFLARIRAVMRRMDAARELRFSREALFLQATTDSLTGLYNRQFLKPFIERNLASAKRYSRRYSLMMIELDNLLSTYEIFGNLSGDGVLKELGSMVKGSLRAGDLAVRYDKNTLVLLLSDTEANGSDLVAERLRRLVENHAFPVISSPRITTSIGVTEFAREDGGMDDIIGRVEEALAAAKQDGRNRVRRL